MQMERRKKHQKTKKIRKNKKITFFVFFVGFSLKYTKTVYINSVDSERGQQQKGKQT